MVVADEAELARLGHVLRACSAQIMDASDLTLDIHDPILSLWHAEGV